MRGLTVVLAVPDVREAVAFYQKLGFHETFAVPGPDGQVVHSELASGTSTLMLGPLDLFHYQGNRRTRDIQSGPRGLGATLMLPVEGVDAIAETLRNYGLQILLEPVDEYYGQRVFCFIDPFGYEWKLTQTIELVDRAEVLRRGTGQTFPAA